MNLTLLDAWATRHHGLITRSKATELGWSSTAWYRAIAAGNIELLHPGVARLVGSATTPEQRIAAGVLAAGRLAMASHRSAARLG